MKKTIILLGIILSIMFVTECSNNSDRVGNTDDEILEYLHKDFMTNIGNDNLTIVDTIYIDNSKIVGFLSDTGQGYFVYEKNKKGDYIMTGNMAKGITSSGLGVTNFVARYNLNNGLENSDYAYIVISNGDIVSNVEISINGHIFNESMEIGKPSMILLNDVMPKSEYKDGVSVDFRYFDINNNELKNDEEY